VAAASRRHRTRELTGGEVTRLAQCSGMSPEPGFREFIARLVKTKAGGR
jgi:hypothetical protein